MNLNREFKNWLVSLRHDLHRHPEVALKEERTTRQILVYLKQMGIKAQGLSKMTGAVGLIRGGQEGPTLAIRADIDALPIQEMNQFPHKSTNPGFMHACGHDAHTAILLGVARMVMDTGLAARMRGNLKLIFQPAEETGVGARMMVERGVLENPAVDRIIAGHVTGDLPVGHVGVNFGQSHASNDIFRLSIKGKGTHGARPHQGNDPIVAGAQLVNALQSVVSRRVDPLQAAVISVCQFQAGSATNVIPETAQLAGTMRAMTVAVQKQLHDHLHRMVRGISETFDVECGLELQEVFPPCLNDPQVVEFMERAASEVVGAAKVHHSPPVTGSEDFAFFSQAVPGAIIRLGCGDRRGEPALHSPHFDVADEALFTGVGIFYQAVNRYLG
ncbi:MAG: amidohydrolase [Proteobacteria bacterium]|nr:amidohydrolase [Pseudomonadota bacterium]MBU1452139.1 amidohydrolase [Pseudomonadota bacterium]MBU2467534.1 amidohydrolase [Pseudomonadota bacterium]MBU2517939.1 amidohydrolase [Pseudomonadota bacterium]